MPLETLALKEKVEHYKELIKNKEEIEKQYNTWKEFYEDLKKETEEAKNIYEIRKRLNPAAAEEAKKEIDSWLQQEKDCLNIIDEFTTKFDEINAELNKYDEETIKAEVEYIANTIRFDEISKTMKEIEKRSKKIAGGATIGTNLIKVENAEGRLKDINEMFAEDYYKLALEKRALAKTMKKQYKALVALVPDEELIVVESDLYKSEEAKEAEVISVIETQKDSVTDDINIDDYLIDGNLDNSKVAKLTFAQQKAVYMAYNKRLQETIDKKVNDAHELIRSYINGVPEKTDDGVQTEEQINEEKQSAVITVDESLFNDYKLDRSKFELLTTEEKIATLKYYQEKLKTAPGRKQLITYKGQKFEMARYYVGTFLNCGAEISRLEKELGTKKLKDADLSVDLTVEDNIKNSLKEDKTKSYADALIAAYSTGVADLTEENLKEEYTDEQYDLDNDELLAMVNRHAEESNVEAPKDKPFNLFGFLKRDNEEEKTKSVEIVDAEIEETNKDDFENIYSNSKDDPKNAIKIKSIDKPKDKEKLKDKLKKAILIIGACAVVALSALGIKTLIDKSNLGKDDKPIDNKPSSSMSQGTSDEDKYHENEKDQNIEVSENSDDIRIGDKVEVKEGALIYTNMYDATLRRNGLAPYFGYEPAREIGGFAINFEGELYFIYSNDENAQEKVDKLINNGGKITAVLGANSNGYEGFYNRDDVLKLDLNVGGPKR